MRWKFVTTFIVNQAQHTFTNVINANDQLQATRKYCEIPAVQDLDFDEFESVTITLEK